MSNSAFRNKGKVKKSDKQLLIKEINLEYEKTHRTKSSAVCFGFSRSHNLGDSFLREDELEDTHRRLQSVPRRNEISLADDIKTMSGLKVFSKL